MIRNVDLLGGFDKNISVKLFLRLSFIFLLPTYLGYLYYKASVIDELSIIISVIIIIFYASYKTFLNESVLLSLISIVLISLPMAYYSGNIETILNRFTNFSLSLIFLLIGFLEIKKTIFYYKLFLFKKFSKSINFYTPSKKDCFWLPEDPIGETYYIFDGQIVDPRDGKTFVSIKRSFAHNIEKAFSPIYHMSICAKLLNNTNDRQLYFHKFYGGLVFLNFMYFFSSLVLIALLNKFFIPLDHLYSLLAIVSFVLFGLWMTVYLFIKNIEIEQCKKSAIVAGIDLIGQNDISENNLDEHYLTLNASEKVNHSNKISELDSIAKDLIKKLDSIYQVVTPLLFLAQVSIAIAALHIIFKG